KLAVGKRSVIFAEVSTGKLLTPDGDLYIGQSRCYQIFDSEEEAMVFAQAHVEQHPEVECSIRDENGKHIRFLRAGAQHHTLGKKFPNSSRHSKPGRRPKSAIAPSETRWDVYRQDIRHQEQSLDLRHEDTQGVGTADAPATTRGVGGLHVCHDVRSA